MDAPELSSRTSASAYIHLVSYYCITDLQVILTRTKDRTVQYSQTVRVGVSNPFSSGGTSSQVLVKWLDDSAASMSTRTVL